MKPFPAKGFLKFKATRFPAIHKKILLLSYQDLEIIEGKHMLTCDG